MIPTTIHYCWFSGEEMPPLLKLCLRSWQKIMPDYKLRLWDADSFDFDSVPFVREAFKARKWAFVTDYIRLYAIYTEGGFYMDTDVLVMRRFDEFRDYSFVSCQEYQPWIFLPNKEKSVSKSGERLVAEVPGLGIQAGILGAESGCEYLKECLNFYQSLTFDGNQLMNLVIVGKMARVLEPHGYRYILETQHLPSSNILIEDAKVFSNMTTLASNTHAWHLYYRGWGNRLSFKQQIRNRHPKIYLLLQLAAKKKMYWSLVKHILSL